jgi:hypothetical protein
MEEDYQSMQVEEIGNIAGQRQGLGGQCRPMLVEFKGVGKSFGTLQAVGCRPRSRGSDEADRIEAKHGLEPAELDACERDRLDLGQMARKEILGQGNERIRFLGGQKAQHVGQRDVEPVGFVVISGQASQVA